MLVPFRGPLTRERLGGLLAAAPEDFGTCNQLSRRLQNLLTPRRRHLLQIAPGDVLEALAKAPASEEREIHRLLKMFLAMFLFFSEGDEIFVQTAPSPESLAAGCGGRWGSGFRVIRRGSKATGAAAEVARYFLEEEARLGETPHLAFLRAGLAYKSGRTAEAFAGFDRARCMFDAGARAYHHYRGAHSIRPLPVFQEALDQGGELDSTFVMESDGGFADGRPILVIGVDQTYYDRYAPRWVKGAEGLVNLHFHVANPDQSRLFRASHLRYSFETCPGASPAYYASMRFLHLHRLLNHYNVPLLVSDADAYLEGDPAVLFQESAPYDMAFMETGAFRDCLPWRHLLAGALWVCPSDSTERFLECFRALFTYLKRNGGADWWVDQALLSASLAVLQERGEAPKVFRGKIFKTAGLKQDKL